LFSVYPLHADWFGERTSVDIIIGDWSYCGLLGNDPNYRSGKTNVTLSIPYKNSAGKICSAGTIAINFGSGATMITIKSKTGQDCNQNPIQDSIAAERLAGVAKVGRSTNVNDRVGKYIAFADNYVDCTDDILVTGTDKSTAVRCGRNAYRLDTVKITGLSQ